MTSFISLTAVLILAMVVISAGGSMEGQGEVLGQEGAGQVSLERDVRETGRRKINKRNRKNQKKQKRQNKQKRKINRKVKDRKRSRKVSKTFGKLSKSGRAEDKFGHCDYIDLVEVGYRDGSISNCAPGGKFLFKVNRPPLLSSTPSVSLSPPSHNCFNAPFLLWTLRLID